MKVSQKQLEAIIKLMVTEASVDQLEEVLPDIPQIPQNQAGLPDDLFIYIYKYVTISL
jgi:hypothetical protein